MKKSVMQNAVKGTVVMSDLEESLKERQTGEVELANIDNFAEEITNARVNNMFEKMHSSPNRNTMLVTINDKSPDIKYSEQSDSSILAFAASEVPVDSTTPPAVRASCLTTFMMRLFIKYT
jgi:hypothetical protein